MSMNLAQRTDESAQPGDFGSEAVTRDIRVRVTPVFMPEHSSQHDRKFVFAYRINITNESSTRVRLVARHWIIVDAFGRTEEVRGEGVVGQQPILDPGESFEYASHCLLKTDWGTMEGTYRMNTVDGEAFDVSIERFYLVSRRDDATPARSTA